MARFRKVFAFSDIDRGILYLPLLFRPPTRLFHLEEFFSPPVYYDPRLIGTQEYLVKAMSGKVLVANWDNCPCLQQFNSAVSEME